MTFFSTEEKLPQNKEYVLCHLTYSNWADKDDPLERRYWVVAQFKLVEEGHSCPNNEKNYVWNEFGPATHFGQSVDFWCPLPTKYDIEDWLSFIEEKSISEEI